MHSFDSIFQSLVQCALRTDAFPLQAPRCNFTKRPCQRALMRTGLVHAQGDMPDETPLLRDESLRETLWMV